MSNSYLVDVDPCIIAQRGWPVNVDYVPRSTCSVAAAILGGGALAAGGAIGGSLIGANAQTTAAQNATNAQLSMFNTSKNALQPFINAGQGGIPGIQSWLDQSNESSPLNALMKLTTPGADMSATLAQTPGYQFSEDRGLRAVNNALAARGLGGSGGAVAKGAADYTTGLAQGTWQNVVNALQNMFTSGAGAKQNLVNTGAGSAGTLTGAATNVGGQVGSNLIGAGNAVAGAATGIGSAVGNLGSTASTAAIIQQLLGKGGAGNNLEAGTGIYGGSTYNSGDAASGFQPYPAFV